MSNHAFIIPAHHQPQLLARTCRILAAENHYFFIHIDLKSGDLTPFKEAMRDIAHVSFVERVETWHGDISQIIATLILMKAVVDSKVNFSYVHQISGQDYPLRSNTQFDDFFEGKDDSYMFFDNLSRMSSKCYKAHYDRVMQWRPNLKGKIWLKMIYYGLRIPNLLKIIIKRSEIEDFSSGSDWFSLHISMVHYVLNYNCLHPDYLCRFVGTAAPCEFYLHTMFRPLLGGGKIHINEPLRYISFIPHRNVTTKYRPFNLTEEDYKLVINSRAFFCRKVDSVESAKLLDMIDAQRGDEYCLENHKDIF